MNRNRPRPGLPTMLFVSELANIGFDRVPPVTLILIVVQFLIYFGLLDDFHNFDAHNVCIGFDTVWSRGEFWRLLTGALVHLDEWHLYFNMASLLWKGMRLEGRRFSSSYYLILIIAFIPLCGLGTIGLDCILADVLENSARKYTCAAGFSAVIFAVKVLTSHYDEAHTVRIFGAFPVNSRYACWAELVAIQMAVPNASFTGHLAGILVGCSYIYGPLKGIIDSIYYVALAPVLGAANGAHRATRESTQNGWANWSFPGRRQPFGGAGSASGYRASTPRNDTFHGYTAGLSEDDQMAWALNESLSRTPHRNPNWAGAAGNRATPSPFGWNLGH